MSTPRRRSPLPPILLVLVPLSLLQTFWGLLPLPGTDPARVINGVLVLPPGGLIKTIVTAVAWTWALSAAVAALGKVDRPLRRTLPVLRTVSGALAAAVATVLVAFLLMGLVLPAGGVVVAVVAAVLALPVGLLLVRYALVLPIAVFEDTRGMAAYRAASAAVRGKVWSLGILLLLGVAAPAQILGWVFRRPEDFVSGPVAGIGVWLLRDMTLVAVAALQAWTLMVAYRHLPGRSVLADAAAPAQESANRAGGIALALGVAAVLVPTALAGGVVASEKSPALFVQAPARPHHLMAVGWPAGRHPVIVGQQAIEDCLDDRCGSFRRTTLSVLMYEPLGGVAFGPDGSVFALGQHELEHCDAQRVCRRREGSLPALQGSGAGAIALSPTGEILIASATEVAAAESVERTATDSGGRVELKLVRCRDVFCEKPTITSFGLVDGSLEEGEDSWLRRRLAVGTDDGDRPVIAFRSPSNGTVSVGWCTTADCQRADVAAVAGPRTPGMPTNEELALLDFDGAFDCLRQDGCTSADPLAVIHRPAGGRYALAVEPSRTEGFHVYVGRRPPTPRRLVLRICRDVSCREPRQIPLVDLPPLVSTWPDRPAHERWLLAVGPDGRMVATDGFGNQIVVLQP